MGWMAAGAVLFLAGGYAYERYWRPPSAIELLRLREERRMLDDRLSRRLAAELRLDEAPDATVLVSMPAPLAEGFAGDVITGLFPEVRLTLRNLKVRKTGELRGKVLVGRRLLGRFAVRLDIHEVRAVVRPGRPRLRFEPDRVGFEAPFTVAGGSGTGKLDFRWDGRGVAGAVCGDMRIASEVGGTVVPARHTIEGGFHLATEGETLAARPDFGEIAFRVRVEPSPETWSLVERTIERQGRVCRAALKAAGVREKIRALLGRGFSVKLPRKLLRDVRLPIRMEPSLDLEGKRLRLRVRPAGLAVTPARLWYGANVELAAASLE